MSGASALDWPRGVCVVSIDTEMAWGMAHRRGEELSQQFDRERTVIGEMLDLFARYEVPATWAVVGHLFLSGCDEPLHPEVARPDYPWLDEDWFDIDPGADLDTAPYYYGYDIVERIRDCPVPQELASHSFAHMLMDNSGCSADVFSSDLAACQAAADPHGVELRSYVYPRNGLAHIDLLADAGYVSYRGGRPVAPFGGSGRRARRALALADKVRPLAGSATWPVRHPSGVVNVPQTYLFAPDARGRSLPARAWARFPAARVRQAARHRSLCHLWFHPYNVTAAPKRGLSALEAVCQVMAKERDRGRLDLLTMRQTAERVIDDATPVAASGPTAVPGSGGGGVAARSPAP